MDFLKKNWSNLLFLLLIVLLIIPQTRKPIQVEILRIFSFAPDKISEEDALLVENYRWDLYDLKANKIPFEEARGEVAIVNLWATWCPPCIAEMPSFQKLYEDYGDKIKFYFVSSEKIGVLENFKEKNNYSFPIVRPGSLGPQNLQSNVLPTTFVIAPSGKIVVKKTGAADWNDPDFRELLNEILAKEGNNK